MLRRFSLALLGAAVVALGGAPSAFAGATQLVRYCGDPVDLGTSCTTTNNFDFDLQKSILVERTLTATGQFVWTGHAAYGHGFIAGNNPIAGPGVTVNEIRADYTDPQGYIDNYIEGLAFDSASNTIFVSDTDDNRVVAYSRGSFDSAGDSPGQYPVDYSRGGSVGGMTGAQGIAFNSFTGQLVVADTGGWRLNLYNFIPATLAGSPPAGGPVLTYDQSFGSADWSDENTKPLDVTTDPTNGHMYVALNIQDTVEEYDSTGQFVQSISTGLTGPNGIAKTLAIDSDARLLYIGKAGSIEVVSLATGNYLGLLDTGFEQSDGASLVDIDVDPISHSLYMVTSMAAPDTNAEAPVTGLQLDPPPTCTLKTEAVHPGATVSIRPNCVDVDGGVIEYSLVGSPTAGSGSNIEDRSAVSYTAPAQVGSATFPFRARSLNGRTTTFNQPVTISEDAPVPVIRKTANLSLSSGVILIKLPGSNKFVPLTEDTLIPMGTIIDATKGKAHLTFDNGDGTTQDGIFWEGVFQVSQGSGKNPITIIKLRDDLVGKASAARAASALVSASVAGSFEAWASRRRGKKKNGVWGDAKGRFRTSGKGGSASVSGTRWYVSNYTYGSLFKVARGKVTVDPIRGKNFPLKAGKQIFVFYKKKR